MFLCGLWLNNTNNRHVFLYIDRLFPLFHPQVGTDDKLLKSVTNVKVFLYMCQRWPFDLCVQGIFALSIGWGLWSKQGFGLQTSKFHVKCPFFRCFQISFDFYGCFSLNKHLIAFFFHLQKLRMPSGDFKEDRLTTSAQSTPIGTPSVTPCVTPCVSPYASPALSRRQATRSWGFILLFLYPNLEGSISPAGSMAEAVCWFFCPKVVLVGAEFRAWFQLSPAALPTSPEANSPNPSTDMGGNEGGGGGERWNFFGTRSVVQKSPTDPGSDSSSGETFTSTSFDFSAAHGADLESDIPRTR